MTHTKIAHSFTYPQLSYTAPKNTQPYIKLVFYFNKLPEVSYEQFYGHWSTVHADLTVASKGFSQFKIQRYVQVSQSPDLKEKAKTLGLETLDYDGCSEIYVKSWEDWMKFYTSEDYAKALGPDCAHFMKMPIKVYAGEENVIFGEGIEEIGGTDGVLRAQVEGWATSEIGG